MNRPRIGAAAAAAELRGDPAGSPQAQRLIDLVNAFGRQSYSAGFRAGLRRAAAEAGDDRARHLRIATRP